MSKILLFSPDKDERARLRHVLSEHGLKVRSAASVRTARQFLEKSDFDLILAPPEALADLHDETPAEERNRIIAEMISDYVYIFRVTETGQLIGEWISESFTRVFGLTLQDVKARGGWQHIVYPPDLPIALQHAQIVAGGQEHVAEFRFITREGEPRWLRDHARPVFDDGGKRVTRIFGASQDITERKRDERVMEAQARIGQVLATTTSLDEVLQHILEAACNAIPAAEKGSILLADEQGENLSIAARWGYDDEAVAA
ncbi:MAG: PAS domain S-box protein, partial [Anaerolineae bacterium]